MPDLPAPPVPRDLDLRDCPWMPVEVVAARDHDLATTPSKAEAFRVCWLAIWYAWHQVPAGSLPKDEEVLAAKLGFGRDVKAFRKVRAAGALDGWVEHADGRLYHPLIVEKAIEAAGQVAKARNKRERDAERLRQWRASQGHEGDETRDDTHQETHDETPTETRFTKRRSPRYSTGQYRTLPDQTGQEKSSPPPSPASSAGGASAPGGGDGARQRIVGIDVALCRAAVQAGDVLGVVQAFNGNLAGSRPGEWVRDAVGMQIGEFAALLWEAMHDRKPIREPSGFRPAREAWDGLPVADRKVIAAVAFRDLGISSTPKDPTP